MTTKPLTVPLAQAALHNVKPLRSLPPSALQPDRSHVDKPKPEAAEMAGKKKRRRARVTAEVRSSGLARVTKLISDGKSSTEAITTVAKEIGVSVSAIYTWRRPLDKPGANGETERPSGKFDGLDLILDILDLCERAKKGLTRSQRVRLKAALNERL
jgi:transposase